MPPINNRHYPCDPKPRSIPDKTLVEKATLYDAMCRYLIANAYADRNIMAVIAGIDLPEAPHDPLP